MKFPGQRRCLAIVLAFNDHQYGGMKVPVAHTRQIGFPQRWRGDRVPVFLVSETHLFFFVGGMIRKLAVQSCLVQICDVYGRMVKYVD